jgi:hypothetical protein
MFVLFGIKSFESPKLKVLIILKPVNLFESLLLLEKYKDFDTLSCLYFKLDDWERTLDELEVKVELPFKATVI